MPSGPQALFWQWTAGVAAAIVAVVMALLAPSALWKRLKALGPWLIGVAAVALAGVFVYLHLKHPPSGFVADSALSGLPLPLRSGYWACLYLFLVLGCGSALWLAPVLKARRSGPAESAGPFPEIDAAWEEIVLRLEEARIDLARQPVFLLMAPGPSAVADFIESAGLQVFAQAPGFDAPIHAHATSEGLLLGISGASAFGTGDPGAEARLAHVCRRLLAQSPDRPGVRGLAVLFPIGWAALPEAVARSASVRDDLQTIRRVLKADLPVFAVFTGMESVPGFPEFVARLVDQVSPQMRDQRVGFAVPGSAPFGGDLVGRGLAWQSGWFHGWVLNLLAGRLTDYRGNAALVALDHEFRRYRKRLRSILESAFSTHRESTPTAFRGCYFVATGPGRADRAFAAGLIRGPRSRIVAEGGSVGWAHEAWLEDRVYRRLALAVGLVAWAICLPPWIFIVGRAPLVGWVGLGGLISAWGFAAFRLRRA